MTETERKGVWVEVPAEAAKVSRMRRLVDLIAVVALADALLLVVLVYASVSGNDDLVSILGPIHGVGFLSLLVMCAKGVGESYWGWWFPGIVLVTLGPIGSLIGDLRVRQSLKP